MAPHQISIPRRPDARSERVTAPPGRGSGRCALRSSTRFSGHNYELRYWLAACGIDPERDVEIVFVPPPLMADALASGTIDGYCVGEPWSTAATTAGLGRIVTVKAALWRSSPEKVLGVAAEWAEREPGCSRRVAARAVPLGTVVRLDAEPSRAR